MGKAVIAVLDDDPRIGQIITAYMRDLDVLVEVFSDPVEFIRRLPKVNPDVLITDVRMPGMDGTEVLLKVKEYDPQIQVIVITGNADKALAMQVLRLGAFDLIEKPVEQAELVECIKRTVRYQETLKERNHLAGQVSYLTSRDAHRWGIEALIGASPQHRGVIEAIKLLQKAETTPVLITGESGTGKELVARAIHQGGARATRPFVAVNCSAMPLELAESQLFGHVRGAFTGATANRKGSFELADGGTLFLDELGDMPAPIQAKLLRVLEDGLVEPVGASRPVHVNVRIIAATNADLEAKLTRGEFRADLYHRLAVFRVNTPPLRERREDIPLLTVHFMKELTHEMGIPEQTLSKEVLDLLTQPDYPGNARELRNMIERALIVSGGKPLEPAHITPVMQQTKAVAPSGPATRGPAPPPMTGNLTESLREMESTAIRQALEKTGGNIAKAARMLGISRAKLYRKMAVLDSGIDSVGSSKGPRLSTAGGRA